MRALHPRWTWCLVSWASLALPVARAQESPVSSSIPPEKIEFFEAKVRPILVQRCYECHSGDQTNGGLRLDYREGLIKGGDSGPAIESGEPQGSLLLRAIGY
ncbi:MAG: c-type cytochrome domain-containing protein, partial [Pirellula sp.]